MKRLFSRLGRKPDPPPAPPPRAGETTTFLTGVDRIDARNVRLLLDTLAELISHSDQDSLVRSIVDRAIRSVNAERGILFLGGEGEELRAAVARDNAARDLGGNFRYSTTVVRQVHEKGDPLSLRVDDSQQVDDLSASVVDLKLRAVMCVRLRYRDKVLGVIYVDSRATAREFTSKDLRFFDALAVALSIALENARLLREALERERLQRDMEIARDILRELLPADPRGLSGFEIAGHSMPAETAAGDYYDFIPGHRGRLGVVVGDVTGHGLGPAVIMTGARSTLRTLMAEDLTEAQILSRLNRHLAEDLADDRFMSMLLGRLDLDQRRFTWSNAGHNSPLLLRADGGRQDLGGTGLALGIESEFAYSNLEPVTLHSGDLLVLFTDGIEESRAPGSDEQYGRERLAAAVENHRGEPTKAVLERVVQDVNAFTRGAAPEDDITLVVIKAL